MKNTIQVGDVFTTTEGYQVKVLEYINYKNINVIFCDTGYKKTVRGQELKNGHVKNPFKVSVCGIGYFGHGPHKSRINGKKTRAYITWSSMLRRCYSEKSLEIKPTYESCSVVKQWHNFQNFASWYYKQKNSDKIGFELDKDLMVLGNDEYGPSVCSFIPHKINSILNDCRAARGQYPLGVHKFKGSYVALISNGTRKQKHLGYYRTADEAYEVYRDAKEKYVREEAEKYKEVLHPKVYKNLMAYSLKELEECVK